MKHSTITNNTETNNTENSLNHTMNRSAGTLYRLALLGGALLSLSTLNAQGQTMIRRSVYSRQTTFSNGQTATTYTSYPALPNYINPGYINPNYALNRAVSAAGTYNPNYNPNYNLNYNPNYNPNSNPTVNVVGVGGAQPPSGPPPQTQPSDTVTAQYARSSQLLVQWSGNSNGVRQVKLAVFDADLNMLGSQIVTQTPVAARFEMTANIAYYGAQVVYASGKVTTTYQPLQ